MSTAVSGKAVRGSAWLFLFVSAAVCASLLLAGCGGDDGDPNDGNGTAPTVTTTTLTGGTVGTAYSQTLTATGDTPLTWSVETGALPNGLTLYATGVISGTPTTANTFNFTVKATNATGSGTKAFSIVVAPSGGVDVGVVHGTPVTYAGETYPTVVIGSQTWFAKNLNYNASGSKCYGDDNANCTKYGRLYNWAAAKTACPSAWHLPTDAEWDVLVDFAGGSNTAGAKLKATSGWNNNGNGTDNYEFSALPGGYYDNSDGFFVVEKLGAWWSATEHDVSNAYYRNMEYDYARVLRGGDSKSKKLISVRCIKD